MDNDERVGRTEVASKVLGAQRAGGSCFDIADALLEAFDMQWKVDTLTARDVAAWLLACAGNCEGPAYDLSANIRHLAGKVSDGDLEAFVKAKRERDRG